MNGQEAPAQLRLDVVITNLCPDGSKFFIGRPNYSHPNPVINAVRGRFERWRFERNVRRFNAFVERYQRVN